MSVRNRLLLSLLGANFDVELDEGLEGDATSADWLLAGMYLAKIRKPDALARFLSVAHPLDVSSLSRWCLFIGLTEDPAYALELFDVLKFRYPLSVSVWADLAVLQTASGYNIQAARSLSVHAALVGRVPPLTELPLDTLPSLSPCESVRFILGNAANFCNK